MSTPAAVPLDIILPGDAGYDDARWAWNLAVDQRPAAVVRPADAAEVAAAVVWAGGEGLRVAVQSTGHGASCHGDLGDTLLIVMDRMRGVRVDAEARTARAEGGAQWADVVALTAPLGLAPLHGTAGDVGVVGYTLGGGLGWLGRRYGLACNRLTAVEAVMPDGTLRRGGPDDPDLLWAVGGGGGGHGVVTAIEFGLVEPGELYAGWLMWPWERSREVLEAWAHWCADLSEDITSIARILQLPPLPELPEPLRGAQLVVVEVCCLGGAAAGEAALAPLRALGPTMDTVAPTPPAALVQLHMDPPEPVPGIGDGGLIDSFGPEAVAALTAAAGPGSGSPLLSVEVRHLGGALGRPADGGGALARLAGEFAVFAVGLPMDPSMATAIHHSVARVLAAMEPFGFGRRYLNFAECATDARAPLAPKDAARLVALRDAIDPGRMLRPNHDVAAVV